MLPILVWATEERCLHRRQERESEIGLLGNHKAQQRCCIVLRVSLHFISQAYEVETVSREAFVGITVQDTACLV